MTTRTIGYALIALGAFTVLWVFYVNSRKDDIPLVFAPNQLLQSVWRTYKENYLEKTGRTVDTSRDGITTSEGQSYTMLRAVWLGDKETFDLAWKWTRDNLQHEDDHLFSWLFGKREDGTYGVVSDGGGYNAASDADSDIALALIFAYSRWQEEQYLRDARLILNDMWAREVVTVNGTPYLAANDVEKTSGSAYVVMNPSYLAPYAYRIFAKVDPAHPWERLVDSSYDLLARSMEAPLQSGTSAGLPPDWVLLDRRSGTLTDPSVAGYATTSMTTNYGYDALRVPWRIALDHQWNGEPRAKELLDRMSFFSEEWEAAGKLASVYTHDGERKDHAEVPAMYGGIIGYFDVSEPKAAASLYSDKLEILFSPDINSWKLPMSYYDDNWAWFGIALYNRLLPDLTASLPPGAFDIE